MDRHLAQQIQSRPRGYGPPHAQSESDMVSCMLLLARIGVLYIILQQRPLESAWYMSRIDLGNVIFTSELLTKVS
jgi:hypothetical protein